MFYPFCINTVLMQKLTLTFILSNPPKSRHPAYHLRLPNNPSAQSYRKTQTAPCQELPNLHQTSFNMLPGMDSRNINQAKTKKTYNAPKRFTLCNTRTLLSLPLTEHGPFRNLWSRSHHKSLKIIMSTFDFFFIWSLSS